jgi:SAM-dependent methyltransferase
MLDVGCGAGRYLHAMQKLGWEIFGVDFSPVAVEAANRNLGVSRVTVGTLSSIDPEIGKFDLITFNHCLEHIADPKGTLREASRRLVSKGKIRITVPDNSGLEARLFGPYWTGLDVPRHLVDFSIATLKTLLCETGFSVERCRPQFAPWSSYGSARNVATSKLGSRAAVLSDIIGVAAMAMTLLSYPLGNRSAIDIVAQKVE